MAIAILNVLVTAVTAQPTAAQQGAGRLLEYFVGREQESRRYCDSKRPGRLPVNYQFEPGGLLERNLGRFSALENLVDQRRRASEDRGEIRLVRSEAAAGQEFAAAPN